MNLEFSREEFDYEDGKLIMDKPGRVDVTSNVYRTNKKGAILWYAELPLEEDVYVGIYFKDGIFSAYSWGGYNCTIDLETGKVLETLFTK